MPSAKISALTALDSTANLAQLYIPLFKADGSPDNPRILASDLLLAADGVNITPAWSGTGTATTPLLVNVTADPGPSALASRALDVQFSGNSVFAVRRAHIGGVKYNRAMVELSDYSMIRLVNVIGFGTTEDLPILQITPSSIVSAANNSISWSNNTGNVFAGTTDLSLFRDAADVLALRRSNNNQLIRVYEDYTNSTDNFSRGVFGWKLADGTTDSTVLRIGTEKGSLGGTARDVAIITDGTARVTYGASGGETKADGHNVTLGTTTGTKIGTATGEKLGFWNATPVVQQVLATGGGATVDNVITLLQTLGLCKQS